MNLAACPALPVSPENGVWYRAIEVRYLPTALVTAHSKLFATRFNEGSAATPQFEVLYLSENPVLPFWEVQAQFGDPFAGVMVANPNMQPQALLNVTVVLHNVADITDVASQQLLATTAQELTGDWRGYHTRGATTSIKAPTGPAPTHELGAALHAVPALEGFRAISAKIPYLRNLVVFPQKLLPGSHIEFHDPLTGTHHSIP